MSNRIKLSVVIPSFYPAFVYGGWVFSSLNTCKELAKLGIVSFVSTTNDNGGKALASNNKSFIKVLDNIFVKYYHQNIKERLSLPMFWGLFFDIKKANLVHVQGIFSISTPLALFYSWLLSRKVILSPHGCLGEWCMADGNASLKKPYLYFCIKPFSKKVLWHTTSEQEKQEVLSHFPNAQVVIIPNGIYAEEFSQPDLINRSEFIEHYTGIKNRTDNVIISMARLHSKKGIDILIEAFGLCLVNHPNTLLLIAGEDFGEKQKLIELCRHLNLRERIFFVGQLEGKERVNFLANADLFALPSHNENFGLVYTEAMASGTPILASTNTPWQEVEKLGIGKWVPNNRIETSRALTELLSSDLKTLGSKSKEFVINNYTWQQVGIKFKQLFESLVA